MMKLLLNKLALAFMGLLIAFCYLGITRAQTASAPIRHKQPVVRPAGQTPNIVGRIGDYVITKQELEKRLMMELRPRGYDSYNEQTEPVDAETLLKKMIAEYAMITEARKQGYLKDETLDALIKRYKDRRLANLLLQKQLAPKLTVTESEIQQKMKADPKLDRARAEAMLKNTKGRSLFEQYYRQIYQKFHVKKLSNNLLKAAQIHQRLLYSPKKPRKVGFIRTYQVKDEMTPEEKNIVLAEYDNGKVTLKDWFDTLCNMAPPGRPRDLNTPKGVEQLLERTLQMPLLVSEARSLGFNKDENLLKQVREYEDSRLLSKVESEKYKEVKEPTTDQTIIYYDKNKELFRTDRTLKIDLIWCEDLKTARKAKADLDSGKDFELVRQKYSLEKKGKPFNTYPSGEGFFWKDLWKGDPNDILGPIKGFYQNNVKWRIVKILEKKPGKVKGYSTDMERRVKERMLSEQREALLAQYSNELLKKYLYKIYTERIKEIDPLDIP